MAAVACKPLGALLHDVTHPIQRFEVVLQRGPPEQPHLGDVGRAHAGFAAFAFDAFEHGGLFAADVGACAPAQLDVRQRTRRVGQQGGEFTLQQPAAIVVLVAQVDVDGFGAHHLGGDQQAFEEAVRVALQVMAVLEGAGLALVDVDGHQPGRGLIAHDAPLAPGRKSGAAQAAQASVFHGVQHGLGFVFAVDHGRRQAIAALRAVVVIDYCFYS